MQMSQLAAIRNPVAYAGIGHGMSCVCVLLSLCLEARCLRHEFNELLMNPHQDGQM